MSTQTLHQAPQASRRMPIPASVQTLAERSTPLEIRLDIQKLMAQDQMELAQALGDAGIALHPRSEDMVAICALLAMSRSDWAEATDLLAQLQEIQGEATPATTYWLLARCHRCQGDLTRCMQVLEAGMFRHPQSNELQSELSLLLKP